MISAYYLLGTALIFNAAANILAKVGMNKIGKADNFLTLIPKIISNPIITLAIGCFAINFGLYALALSRINLNVAYPIMVGLGYTIIILTSWFFLKETITLIQMIGILFILVGLLLLGK